MYPPFVAAFMAWTGCRFFILFFCLWLSLLPRSEAAGVRPNIVYILADDLGYGDLSCQNSNSKIHTPRLDTLASQGMMFTSAHAPSSLCTPSRYSILTGQFCWRSRLKSGVLNMWDEPLLAPERLTVADLLHSQGYTTGCFGKWHLGLSWPFVGTVPPGFDTTATASSIDWTQRISGGPVDHGFDYFFGVNIPNQPPYAYILNDHVAGVPTVEYDSTKGLQSHWAGPGVAGWDWSQVLPTVLSNANAWIDQCTLQTASRPFFLYLALPGPHQPVVPTAAFTGTSQAGLYGDYVQELDWAVGQVLDKLVASGAATNTLVIFTSDNGPDEFAYERLQQYGHSSMGALRGIKNDLWEGGHRVPFIARWPGKIAAGSMCQQTICHVDFMRTIADVLQVELPANAAEDSVSFLPALLGTPLTTARSSLVLESGPGQFGLYSNNWMFIDSWTGDGHNPEMEPLWFKQARDYPITNIYPALLYDLHADLAESTNLYPRQLALANQLQSELHKERSEQTWRGNQSGSWVNRANWSRGAWPQGCDLLYSNLAAAANFTQTLGTNFDINSLSVGSITQPMTLLAGGPFVLTISNGIDMFSAGADLSIQTPLCSAASQIWNVTSNRTLTCTAPVWLNGSELRICGGGNVVLSNSLSGPGRLVIRNSGFVLLAGNNTFSGGTELSGGGLLVAQHDNALGRGSLEIPNNSSLQIEPTIALTNRLLMVGFGATFQNICRGAVTMYHPGTARLDGAVELLGDSGVYAHAPGGVLIFGGAISGSGSLTIMPGMGSVVFETHNLYTGATFIQGKLSLWGGPDRLPLSTRVSFSNASNAMLVLNGNSQALSSISGGGPNGGNVDLGGATLTLNQAGTSLYAGSILGSGEIIKSGPGSLTLAGLCSFVGRTLVNGGSLQVDGTMANCAVTVTNATLLGTGVINGPVVLARGGRLVVGNRSGTLKISNSLTLCEGSTTAIEIDATGQATGRIQGLAHVVYGGTLLVNILADTSALAVGQTFHILDAATSEGQFSAIEPSPGPGLAWNFVASNGTLKVVARPLLNADLVAGNLVLSWSDPAFHLQVQTNSPSGGPSRWLDYPMGSTSPIIVPRVPNQALFLRLVSP